MGEGFDPFTIEIVKAKLHAAADEMGVVLARTSMSPIVYEVLDFACGITDADAQVVAQTNGLTLFTGTLGRRSRASCASTASRACARAMSSPRTSRTRAAPTPATSAWSSRSSCRHLGSGP